MVNDMSELEIEFRKACRDKGHELINLVPDIVENKKQSFDVISMIVADPIVLKMISTYGIEYTGECFLSELEDLIKEF
jgi:hypothetical protein